MECRDRELVRKFEAKKERTFSKCPVVSADGKLLLASTGGAIDVWQFASGDHLKRIETDADFINTLVLTPDQKRLIAAARTAIFALSTSSRTKCCA